MAWGTTPMITETALTMHSWFFQANSSTAFINDLIERLKLTSELQAFNFQVQERFRNHVNCLKELKSLQKRYYRLASRFPSILKYNANQIYSGLSYCSKEF